MTTQSTNVRQRRYYVYVVELDRTALHSPAPCVYVGETALVPTDRLTKHRNGGRTASKIVKRHGVQLRPDLTSGWGPYDNREAAVAAETALARTLRARGYHVFGGQGYSFRLRLPGLGSLELGEPS